MTTLIRGDTWRIECVYGRLDGATFVPESIAGVDITSMMRFGAQSFNWTVVDREAEDGTGRFWLTAAAADTAITASTWDHDIQAVASGVVRSTRVSQITVAQDVTNAD